MTLKKRILLFGLISLLLTSCITSERCARRYPLQVKDSIVYKHIEVPVYIYDTFYIKGDTVRLVDTVYIGRDGLVYSDTIKTKSEYASAEAWVWASQLGLELYQNDTAIARLIEDSAIVEVKEIYRDRVQIVNKKYTPFITKLLSYIGIGAIVLIIIRIALNLIKPL